MELNKKGSSAKQWIYALSFLFVITFMFIIFNTVYGYNIAPTFQDLLNNDSAGQQASDGIDFYMDNYKKVFYILFFIDIIYMFILLVKTEPVDTMGGYYRE